jgi:hypothetical protein
MKRMMGSVVFAVLAISTLGTTPLARSASIDPLDRDAAEYARTVGVSQSEAARRLEIQGLVGELAASPWALRAVAL